MKAVYFESHGGREVLRWGEQPEAPEPARGEVRLRIRAAALNHLDIFVRDGLPNVRVPLPMVAGADGAGEIESCGENTEGLSSGDRVLVQPGLYCGTCEFCRSGEQCLCIRYELLGEHRHGTFAERITLPARNVFPIPAGISFETAASFPLVYQTAWRMMVGRARARAGETVLIHGIGGGVAWAALQIALLSGCRVFVTSSSEEKLSEARKLGAENGWLAREGDLVRSVAAATAKRGCDVVVDSVGDATWLTSLKAAARGGRIVTCGATSGPNPSEEIRLIFWKQLSILGSTMANDHEFRAMLAAVFSGKLEPRIDSIFPMERAVEAYTRLESGAQHGKVVLTL